MADDLIYSRTQHEFVDSVLQTVEQRDGILLDDLFNVTRMYQVADLDFDDDDDIDLDQALSQDRETLWKQLSQLHWATCRHLYLNNIDRAFRYQSNKFACFMAILSAYQSRRNEEAADTDYFNDMNNDDELSWLLPLLNRHAHELRLLALMGNDESNNDENEMSDGGNSNSTIQKLTRQLTLAIPVIQRFPQANKMKRVGNFIIVNHMLKTYYALQKYNLCTFFISKGKISSFDQIFFDVTLQRNDP